MSFLNENEINELCIIEEDLITLKEKIKKIANNIKELEYRLEMNKIKDTQIDIEYFDSFINKNNSFDFEKIDEERKSILKREQLENEILELLKRL